MNRSRPNKVRRFFGFYDSKAILCYHDCDLTLLRKIALLERFFADVNWKINRPRDHAQAEPAEAGK